MQPKITGSAKHRFCKLATMLSVLIIGALLASHTRVFYAQDFAGQLLNDHSANSQPSAKFSPSDAQSNPGKIVEAPLHAAAVEDDSSASEDVFPPLLRTSFPVTKIPNWGAMRTPEQWNRTYDEMMENDFVPIPRYDLAVLTTPMDSLTSTLQKDNIPLITAKLFYSTRFLGTYDLDSAEFTGTHAGIDLKLAEGTPIGAIGGGRVSSVETDAILGLHVIIEHRLASGDALYSVYAHLGSTAVKAGVNILSGETIGTVGMTGETTAPHLHLQIDRGNSGEAHHIPYEFSSVPSKSEALLHVVHPITFINANR